MADDERRAEIEAVARALQARYLGRDDWRTFADEARTAIAALDRVRDARGDDEGLQRENERLRSALDTLNETFAVTTREWGNEMARLRSARSPQGEDHEAGIEAAAQAVAGKLNSWLYAVGLDTAERVDIASYEIAEVALDAVRVRDARGDDEPELRNEDGVYPLAEHWCLRGKDVRPCRSCVEHARALLMDCKAREGGEDDEDPYPIGHPDVNPTRRPSPQDEVRDARGDDEAPRCDECGHLWSRHRGTVCLDCEAARSPQGECPDHKWMGRVRGSDAPCPHCEGRCPHCSRSPQDEDHEAGEFTICTRCWSVVGIDGENNMDRAPVACSHLGPFIQASPSCDGTVAVEDVVAEGDDEAARVRERAEEVVRRDDELKREVEDAIADMDAVARPPQGEDHESARPEQPPPDRLGGQPPAEPPEAP